MRLYRRLLITLTIAVGLTTSCVTKEVAVTQPYYETQFRTENITESYTENVTTAGSFSGEYGLPSYYRWSSSDISFFGFLNVYYFGYDIPDADLYDDMRLKIQIWKQEQYELASILIYDVTRTGQLSYPDPPIVGDTVEEGSRYKINGSASSGWLHSANLWIGRAKFLGGRTNLFSTSNDPQIIEVDAGKAKNVAVIISGPANAWNVKFALNVIWTARSMDNTTAVKERQVQQLIPYQVQRQKTVYQIKQVPFWENIFLP